MDASQHESQALSPGGDTSERLHQYRVLVVEDEEEVLRLTQRIVEFFLKCEVLQAADGDVALAQLAVEPFDIMITDMMMPGTHGLELVKRVRAEYPDLAILVMTGYTSAFPFVEVIKAGADDFIAKPFQAAEMEAKLVRICRERELFRENLLAQRKYRSLFDLSGDGMVLVERAGHAVLDVNKAFCDLVEHETHKIVGECFLNLLSPADAERFKRWLDICARGGRGTIGDLMLARPGKQPVIVDITVTFIEVESESLMFLACRDVTEKREVDQKLADAVQRDKLTKLYNKGAFESRIEWAVARAREQETPLLLMTIDLDNFKQCNDTHGHPVGDKLLALVGETILKSTRTDISDEGFRCGGDEFSLILPGAKKAGGLVVAKRMRDYFAGIETYGTTMSIGVAEFSPELTTAEFVDLADKALYSAKRQGKNTVQCA